MLNLKIVTGALGLWASISFIACVLWGLFMPESLHMHAFLEMVLPGFKWLSWWGFLLGLIESFLYGFYAGFIYVPIYNFLYKKWGAVSVL